MVGMRGFNLLVDMFEDGTMGSIVPVKGLVVFMWDVFGVVNG